jgi:crooked neck
LHFVRIALDLRLTFSSFVVALQEEGGWEEYYDYVFPDEEAKLSTLAMLEAARRWKKQKLQATEPASAPEAQPATAGQDMDQ